MHPRAGYTCSKSAERQSVASVLFGENARGRFPSELSYSGKEEQEAKKRSNAQKTVLIVDDDRELRYMNMVRLHNGLGYRTLTAGNGKEAIEMFGLKANEISLVLMDMEMPGMNGLQVLRRMMEIRDDIKIVFFSGAVTDGLAHEMIHAGARAVLTKPADSIVIEAVMERVLNGEKGIIIIDGFWHSCQA